MEKDMERDLATIKSWREADKDCLEVKKIFELWESLPSKSSVKANAWSLVMEEAEAGGLKQRQWVWRNAPIGSPEEREIYTLMQKRLHELVENF